MFNSRRVFVLLLVVASWGAVPAHGFLEVEDFDAAPAGGFNNPFFNHNLGPDTFGGNGPRHLFSAEDFISADHSLFIFPGTDFVTFSLAPGTFVDYAEIWFKGTMEASPTIDVLTLFELVGVDGDGQPKEEQLSSPQPASGEWMFFSSAGLGFARIDEVRLTASKTAFFDDLKVNVVPEPATAGLLLVGAVAMLRSGRKRRRLP